MTEDAMSVRLLAIVGPTGIGKSDLALRLARQFGGEIVNADSRQVYRHMDLGTAKPSPRDRATVRHHLVDVADPDEDYSLAMFLAQAKRAIDDIHLRTKLPILVGGTGQYVWGLLEGWRVPSVPPDLDLRRRLEGKAAEDGYAALHAELSMVDPDAAAAIDARNVRRVIRALEVAQLSPRAEAGGRRKIPPPYRTRIVGLTLDRPALYERIDRRIDRMIASGWVNEVCDLMAKGYSPSMPSMSSLGYIELAGYLAGELTLPTAIERIKHRTHKLARKQYSWFRPTDERIHWFDTAVGIDQIDKEVAKLLEIRASRRPS